MFDLLLHFDHHRRPTSGTECSVFSVQCSVFSVQCSVFSVQCSVFSVGQSAHHAI